MRPEGNSNGFICRRCHRWWRVCHQWWRRRDLVDRGANRSVPSRGYPRVSRACRAG